MGLIFSNTLEIKDKFTSTLNSFKNATKDSFSFFAKSQKDINKETVKAKKTLEESYDFSYNVENVDFE